MEIRLVLKHAKKRTKVFRLRDAVSILGRARGVAVRIPAADVSREHCEIVVQDGVVTVEDLGSLNGTLLNGVVVDGPQEIHPGDFLRVGPALFVVEFNPAELDVEEAQEEFEVVEDDVAGDKEMTLELEDDPTDDQPIPLVSADEPATPVHGNPDESMGWHMPEAGDLRDLLSQLDEATKPPPTSPKKSKKK